MPFTWHERRPVQTVSVAIAHYTYGWGQKAVENLEWFKAAPRVQHLRITVWVRWAAAGTQSVGVWPGPRCRYRHLTSKMRRSRCTKPRSRLDALQTHAPRTAPASPLKLRTYCANPRRPPVGRAAQPIERGGFGLACLAAVACFFLLVVTHSCLSPLKTMTNRFLPVCLFFYVILFTSKASVTWLSKSITSDEPCLPRRMTEFSIPLLSVWVWATDHVRCRTLPSRPSFRLRPALFVFDTRMTPT